MIRMKTILNKWNSKNLKIIMQNGGLTVENTRALPQK